MNESTASSASGPGTTGSGAGADGPSRVVSSRSAWANASAVLRTRAGGPGGNGAPIAGVVTESVAARDPGRVIHVDWGGRSGEYEVDVLVRGYDRKGLLKDVSAAIAAADAHVLAAIFAKPFLRWMNRNRKYLRYVEKAMGVMLILFAVLIATGSVNAIADFMIRYMPWTMNFV